MKKILIIESSFVIRKQIKNIFKNETNLEFIEANTSKKAMDALQIETPNILLVVLGIHSDKAEINGSREVVSEFLLKYMMNEKSLSSLPRILTVQSRYLRLADDFQDNKLAERIIKYIDSHFDSPRIITRPFTNEEFIAAVKSSLPQYSFMSI